MLIERSGPAPDELRDIVQRGSTEIVDPTDAAESVDRVVIWDTKGTERTINPQGSAEWPDTAQVFLVAPDSRGVPAPETSNVFAWPADEDRFKMAFMTGA
jgi:hypothetical protein